MNRNRIGSAAGRLVRSRLRSLQATPTAVGRRLQLVAALPSDGVALRHYGASRIPVLRAGSAITDSPRPSPDLGSTHDKRAATSAAVRELLRTHGPLPLPHLSRHLDDDTMEWVAGQQGGLAGFLAGRAATGGPTSLPMATVPGGIRVVFPAHYAIGVPEAERPLALALAALFVAAHHFRTARLLPSPQPTVAELFLAARQRAWQGMAGGPATLAAFHVWLQLCRSVFFVSGTRVVLARDESPEAAQQRVKEGVRHCRLSRVMPVGSASGVKPVEAGHAVGPAALRAAVTACVPAGFFIPASVAVRAAPLSSALASTPYDGSPASLRAVLAEGLPQGLLDVRVFGETLADTYLRLLDSAAAVSTPLAAQSECGATVAWMTEAHEERFGVLALGERVVMELARARAGDPAQRRLQARGLRMADLPAVLSPDTIRSLRLHFTDEAATGEGEHESAGSGVSLDVCILLFDRLRHVFDVRLQTGVVRPWSVLPAEEQPSSLTSETTPLPLLLRHAQSALLAETLSVEELVSRLPASVRRQLLCAYGGAAGLNVAGDTAAPASADTMAREARYMRGFIRQHSLYFVLRRDADGAEKVCSPKFLAAAYVESGTPGSNWSNAGRYTDVEKAQMVYQLLPVDQPVAWTHFSNTAEVRALPFPAFRFTQDFFRRFPSLFRVYEGFATCVTIVGRADGVPPPADVLAVRMSSVDDMVRHLALHAVGGTSEGVVTQNLPREGRALLRRLGSFAAVAEQLPEWFVVQRDRFNANNTLITYIGPGVTKAAEEDARHAAELPLRSCRNDASCYLPVEVATVPDGGGGAGGEEDYSTWNSDWDEV